MTDLCIEDDTEELEKVGVIRRKGKRQRALLENQPIPGRYAAPSISTGKCNTWQSEEGNLDPALFRSYQAPHGFPQNNKWQMSHL